MTPEMFRCLAVLEKKIHDVYRLISSRTDDMRVSLILLFISYDSLKHSVIFESMAEIMRGDEHTGRGECRRELGEAYEQLIDMLSEIEGDVKYKRSLSYEELADVLEKLVQAEECINEECLVQVISKAMSEQGEEGLSGFREVFGLISKDEEKHNILLKDALEYLEVREKEARRYSLKLE